jgi:hypothetical protein
MRRMLAIISSLLLLSAFMVGAQSALLPPVTLLIVPDATDVHVTEIGMGARFVTYYAPGGAYAWRTTVERNLAAHGWMVPIWWRADMPVRTYIYRSPSWFGVIWDGADLAGGPNAAQITIHRWIEFPQWIYRLRGRLVPVSAD